MTFVDEKYDAMIMEIESYATAINLDIKPMNLLKKIASDIVLNG